MKRTKIVLPVMLLLIVAVAITACPGQRSGADLLKWRYQSFVDKPPSWEDHSGLHGPLNMGERYRGPW